MRILMEVLPRIIRVSMQTCTVQSEHQNGHKWKGLAGYTKRRINSFLNLKHLGELFSLTEWSIFESSGKGKNHDNMYSLTLKIKPNKWKIYEDINGKYHI